jgi:hypothetical protein
LSKGRSPATCFGEMSGDFKIAALSMGRITVSAIGCPEDSRTLFKPYTRRSSFPAGVQAFIALL